MLGNMKIGVRLGLGFGLVLVLLLVMILIGVSGVKRMNDKLDRIVKVNNARMRYTSEMRDSITRRADSLQKMLLFKGSAPVRQELEKMQEAGARYDEALERLDKLEISEGGKRLIGSVKTAIGDAREADKAVIGLVASKKVTEAASLYGRSAVPLLDKVYAALTELVTYQEKRILFRHTEAEAVYRNTLLFLFITAGAAMVLGTMLGILITRSITKPLANGIAVIDRLAGGDLTAGIAAAGRDEIGQLLAATNAMAANMKEIIRNTVKSSHHVALSAGKVAKDSDQIVRAAQEEASATEETTSSIEEMAVSMSQVAQNTETLATNVDETSSTITEMAASIEQVGKSAEAMAASVEETSATIEQMLASVEQTARNTGAMTEAVGRMRNMVHEVGIAVREQVGGTRQIVRTVEAMHSMTRGVANATAEQKMGGRSW
ncbi:MAG: MCP four helix bundle domain-containing protein [Nitrospirae bacterium]|nr:MCP four helix bundle domain-containing protein [Nitrospirota bacterium]